MKSAKDMKDKSTIFEQISRLTKQLQELEDIKYKIEYYAKKGKGSVNLYKIEWPANKAYLEELGYEIVTDADSPEEPIKIIWDATKGENKIETGNPWAELAKMLGIKK